MGVEPTRSDAPLKVAVIGAGVSGLCCAWLLASRHAVTLFEAEHRIGGHANTVDVPDPGGDIAVDTGFIVYNVENYPNLVALFGHLGVETQAAQMSFGVSLDGGRLEYGSAHPLAIFAQPSNLFRPRFWSMLADLVRFYRETPGALDAADRDGLTLGQLLEQGGYGQAFKEDHLLPQVGAIWSTSPAGARDYPAAALIRFFDNHGLLKLVRRPQWRTVTGGSRAYVARMTAALAGGVAAGRAAVQVRRLMAGGGGVVVRDDRGVSQIFDRVVIATHADQALALLAEPSPQEREVLGAFRYSRNLAILHEDAALMPRRRAAWSAWNHLGRSDAPEDFCVTYWMNALQSLPRRRNLFVTLNPDRPCEPSKVLGEWTYEHPMFDAAAMAAQRRLWSLQGRSGVWFCGAHFGAGFHEDGAQAGLAVAEALGGVRRPWRVAGESGRIHLGPCWRDADLAA